MLALRVTFTQEFLYSYRKLKERKIPKTQNFRHAMILESAKCF